MTALCALESIARTGSFARATADQQLTAAGLGLSIRRQEAATGLELVCSDPDDGRRKVLSPAGFATAASVGRFLASLELFFEHQRAKRPARFGELSFTKLCDLEAFARAGRMSLAAQMEGTSVPNVSVGLAKLEKMLGVKLTAPHPTALRRKLLTDAGAELASAVRALRTDLDRIYLAFIDNQTSDANGLASDRPHPFAAVETTGSARVLPFASGNGEFTGDDALQWLAGDDPVRVVLGPDRKVVWKSLGAARRLKGRALYLADARLCVWDPADQGDVDSFLASVGPRSERRLIRGNDFERSVMATGHTLAGKDGSMVCLTLRPLAGQHSCAQSGMGRDFGLRRSECRVVDGYLQGRSPYELAADLAVSVHTIRTHTRLIYRKIGITSSRELMMIASAYCSA